LHAQIYGAAPTFKLHEIVEVVGILSIVPSLANFPQQNQNQQQEGGPGAAAAAAVGEEGGMDVEMWGDEFAAYAPTSKVSRPATSFGKDLLIELINCN
jgi:hypothetical protein